MVHLKRTVGNPFVYLKEAYLPSFVSTELVARPQALYDAAAAVLAERPRASPVAQAALLRERLPCLADVVVRRSWLRRKVVLEARARVAVAAAKLKSGPGYLADDGAAFPAPEGVYDVQQPVVEAGAAAPADLAAAAALLRAAAKAGAIPSPVAGLKWSADGWTARLQDGTEVLWGDGRWTGEKLSRLREVVADAGSRREPLAPFTVDLRYFEDGKILLRPLPPRALTMR